MRRATLVVVTCAALALVAAAFDADARGGRSGGGGRGGKSSGPSTGHHSHGHSHQKGQGSHAGASQGHRYKHGHSHGHASFFVGTSFVFWPAAYYWPGYYPGAAPVAEYWYYCQPYAAYYPYVQDCPVEWQLVLPTIPSPEG